MIESICIVHRNRLIPRSIGLYKLDFVSKHGTCSGGYESIQRKVIEDNVINI